MDDPLLFFDIQTWTDEPPMMLSKHGTSDKHKLDLEKFSYCIHLPVPLHEAFKCLQFEFNHLIHDFINKDKLLPPPLSEKEKEEHYYESCYDWQNYK